MAFIYAVSDIHGYLQPLEEALSLVDLDSDMGNKFIFCGDYIDYGSNSCQTLYKVKEMADKYPNQIITLMGNHEYMFLDFLNAKDNDIWNVEWLGSDKDFATVNSFISLSTREKISQLNPDEGYHNYLFRISKIIKEDILMNHSEIVKWLKGLPFYYETENQIYVHAGIDEEAEEYWKYGSENYYFVSKYPFVTGSFYKDIIAGHVSTSTIVNDENYHKIFWDQESHFYIDGNTNKCKFIPVLKYDSTTGKYSSFEKVEYNNGSFEWHEYTIKSGR